MTIATNPIRTGPSDHPHVTTETSSTNFALEGGFEYILKENRHVQLYIGGMLQFGTKSTETPAPDGGEGSAEVDGKTIAIAGLVGVNWFFVSNVSLGAEYRLGYVQETEERGDRDSGITRRENTKSNFGVGSVGLILSFWF